MQHIAAAARGGEPLELGFGEAGVGVANSGIAESEVEDEPTDMAAPRGAAPH